MKQTRREEKTREEQGMVETKVSQENKEFKFKQKPRLEHLKEN